jgi:hypothetical protein
MLPLFSRLIVSSSAIAWLTRISAGADKEGSLFSGTGDYGKRVPCVAPCCVRRSYSALSLRS